MSVCMVAARKIHRGSYTALYPSRLLDILLVSIGSVRDQAVGALWASMKVLL